MQTLITISICAFAAIYLIVKWMPSPIKQRLVIWISAYSPRLAATIGAPVGGCASGCSSCGSCESPVDTKKKQSGNDIGKMLEKPIRFVKR